LRRLALEALCHAERRSDSIRLHNDDKEARIQRWLDRQIAHEEVRRLALEELPELEPAERAAALERAAAEGGLSSCPHAELWRWRVERAHGSGLDCVEACELRLRDGTIEIREQCRLGCAGPDREAPSDGGF
jgi:hypothetical protein